jgi:hypothetical protein
MSQFAYQRKGNELSKSIADLGGHRFNDRSRKDLEIESRVSDLSGDEWHEIIKYERDKFEEDKQKQKEDFLNRRKMIKETLDRQLRERNQRIRKEIEDKKHFDKILLDNAKKQEE